MRSSRLKARELIEAAGRGPGERVEVSADNTLLLGAIDLLKASAPAPAIPDAQFSANLRTGLIARYDELVTSGHKEQRVPSTARRVAWITLPAAAAAAAVILALVFFVFKPAGPAAVARLTVQSGFARLVGTDGKATKVTGEADVRVGDRVVTADGSRATITYDNDNITRLEASSELEVEKYGRRLVAVALSSGKAYNRVIRGTSYSVYCLGVTARAAGTAFDVDVLDSGIDVPVFEGGVKVSWPGGGPAAVAQGFRARITIGPGTFEARVAPFDLAELDFSWLAFNRDLDRKLGFPLGVLEGLGPSTTVPGDTGTSQGTQPDSGQTQQTDHASAALSLGGAGPPVYITWQASNVERADTYAVVRVEGAAQPSYPGNVIETGPAPGVTSYRDGSVTAGRTYTYRVVYLADDSVLVYSNSVTVTVPAPSLSLSGEMTPNGMYLRWSLSGGANIDSWAVLVSRTTSRPGYPGSLYDTVPYSGLSGSYTVYKADPYATCYYRVAALTGGSVVVYSNTITYRPTR